MKIKQTPDDFCVDEQTEVTPTSGPYALYRLHKRGWTTHDVLRAIRRLWQIPRQRLSYGGLKDRHADTTQHLTIEAGPRRDLRGSGWHLKYLGQVPRPFTSADIQANSFRLVVRSLAPEQVSHALSELPRVEADGLANYFDDQRFGSISPEGDFVARRMVMGDWAGALRLALTAPYEFDRSAEKAIKATLRQCWGDWAAAKARLPRCHARSLVDYLAAHPTDFRGAVARLRPDLLSLYLSAYQSHLWNQMLAHWFRTHLAPTQMIDLRFKRHRLPMPYLLTPELSATLSQRTFPLPSARLREEEPIDQAVPDWQESVRAVLAEERIDWKQLTLRGLRRPFFSKGERMILVRPRQLSGESVPDDRHPGRFLLRLQFTLPRGSYATLMVKRLFGAVPPTTSS